MPHLSKMIRGRYYRMKEWRRADVKGRVAVALPEVGEAIREVSGIIEARRPEEKGKTVEQPEVRDLPDPVRDLIDIINKQNHD